MKGKRHNRNGMMKRYGDEARHLYARTGDKVNVTDILLNMLVQREQRNELPWLTPQRAVELYEAWRRGEQADVQRVWEQLEETDDTLMTVLDKRQRALERMPWGILADAEAVGDNEELARKSELQQAYLRTVFNAVENLDEALVHLGMADFRGVAALEITGNMQRMRWEVIEPWCLARPVRRGPWMYNAKADSTYTFLEELEREAVIVREARPIDLAAMFLIVDKMHAIHGWDAFLDVFGNPSIFLELPAATSQAMADVYDKLAKRIIGDGRGTIPNGSKFQTVETRQNNCDSFEKRAKWCREAIITVATGGLLTVSTEAGSGTLAGNAHADSFESLVAGTAAAISAVINKQFVRRLLAAAFPDEPALAYFSLAPEPADERLEMAQLLTTLKTAGWQTTAEKASELMQMELEAAPAPAAGAPGEIQNTKDEIQKPVVGEPVANRGDDVGEEALTEDELRAFTALGTPNAGRMTARLIEVEAALRKAADIGADAPVNSEQVIVNSDESLKVGGDVLERLLVANSGPGGEKCEAESEMTCRCDGVHPSKWAPITMPDPITPDEARARLQKGVKVTNPLGEDVTLDGRLLEHWAKGNKSKDDVETRLSSLPLVEKVINTPAEIWEDDRGARTYLASVLEPHRQKGKSYMIAFTQSEDNSVLETYRNTERISKSKRTGKRVYPQGPPDVPGT